MAVDAFGGIRRCPGGCSHHLGEVFVSWLTRIWFLCWSIITLPVRSSESSARSAGGHGACDVDQLPAGCRSNEDLPQSPGVGGDVSKAQHDEFHDYVAARGPALLRAAMFLTSDRAEAEDLLQVALAKTYLAWERINDRGAVDGYVRRAMVNTQISWWRQRKLEVYPTDELPEQPVDDHTRRSDLRDALGRALGRLPKRQRVAVMLRYYEDMSEAEIADVLGISVGTVKSTVSRAVARLRVDTDLEHDFIGTASPAL